MKTFKFSFEDYDDSAVAGTYYPSSSRVTSEYTFDDATTWVPILWQMCKFLEATGYEGVKEKVVIKDPYGLHSESLFETLGPEDDFEFEEDEDLQEELFDDDNDYDEVK